MEDDIQTPPNADRLDADAVTPPNDDGGAKPIADEGEMVLSDDDMALLKQMSPEGQAMIMGLMSGEAAEHEAMELAAANAEGADIATDETLIAEAAAASTRAYNDAAALTEGVRKDGHDGIVGAASASAKALDIIGDHLPSLKPDAEAALKAGNVASFLRFYDAAEGKRRERLLNDQGAVLVGAFRADDVGVTSAPAPFILPAAHVR